MLLLNRVLLGLVYTGLLTYKKPLQAPHRCLRNAVKPSRSMSLAIIVYIALVFALGSEIEMLLRLLVESLRSIPPPPPRGNEFSQRAGGGLRLFYPLTNAFYLPSFVFFSTAFNIDKISSTPWAKCP
jgi:hypothetical protein